MFRLIEVATGLAAVEGPYFAALGIPVVAGSLLQRANPDRPSEEVVVSRELAIRVWGDSTGRAALGQRIRFGDPRWLTVVGVVGDVRAQSLAQPGQPAVYLPITTPWLLPAADAAAEVRRLAAIASPRAMNAVVEVSANPVAITGAVREAIREWIELFRSLTSSRCLACWPARSDAPPFRRGSLEWPRFSPCSSAPLGSTDS